MLPSVTHLSYSHEYFVPEVTKKPKKLEFIMRNGPNSICHALSEVKMFHIYLCMLCSALLLSVNWLMLLSLIASHAEPLITKQSERWHEGRVWDWHWKWMKNEHRADSSLFEVISISSKINRNNPLIQARQRRHSTRRGQLYSTALGKVGRHFNSLPRNVCEFRHGHEIPLLTSDGG